MAFRRRRGNLSDDTEKRRHTLFEPSASGDLPPPVPSQPDHNDDEGQGPGESSHPQQPRELARESTTSRPEGLPESQTESRPGSRPDTPPIQEENSKHHRFSVLRFRNASDSQLSLRAKQQSEKPPPVPRPPEIITTAPTNDFNGPKKKSSRIGLTARFRRSTDLPREDINTNNGTGRQKTLRKSFTDDRRRPTLATLEEPESPRPSTTATTSSPNETTPKKSGPFFRLRRHKKAPEPLFPFAHLQQQGKAPPGISSASSLGISSTPRPASAQSGRTAGGNTTKGDSDLRPGQSPATTLVAPGGIQSGHSSPTRGDLLRGRSSTMSSMGRDSNDDHLLPPTTRTSSSTGRKSFGDLFGLSRLRQNSELSRQGTMTPTTPGSIGSKNNSLQLARDSFVLPERNEDESPAKYLARVEEVASRGIIAATLSKSADPFMTAVLRSYMRSFSFFGDPMDMAIRKLLMEAELPKETQQIDRCLQAFANRYHECNPGIYSSPDQAYFIAFSLLILHTDVFNKNNKHKMQKADYLKNTNGEGIFDDILELNDPAKRAVKEPIDPYTLILDGSLDALRPNLKDAMELEDHYNYLGSATSLNLKDLQKTFFRTGVLQIVSARSRPDAFMTEQTASNPADAHPGIVDIKVTKVGLLWRKDAKKRWVKSLMHQYENHIKAGHDGTPLIFTPPLQEFKPDGLMSTYAAVALHDAAYKKHKNAFVYVRQGGLEEVLLADNEEEMNDWLAKLNYAAAFRTTGVKMRGVIGGNYDGQSRRGLRRLDSADAATLIQTPTGPVSIARSRIDHKMAEDISAARRDVMKQKIAEADEHVQEIQKQLEHQLRNARHLLILAPIQPRTREQLLSAAARISAQLKWTRQDMWKHKCHRDILIQDLEEEHPSSTFTPTKQQSNRFSQRTGSPTPRVNVGRRGSRSTHHSGTEADPRTPTEPQVVHVPNTAEVTEDVDSPLDQVFTTPPQSATKRRHSSRDLSFVRPEAASTRHGSISSIAQSPIASLPSTPLAKPPSAQDESNKPPLRKEDDGNHDPDADERDFLEQAGLLEQRPSRDPTDKATVSTGADVPGESGTPTDKGDRSKIRRSLQRTLREGAGHLSHHRGSRKGKEVAGSGEESNQEHQLSRGTGSFVVHGKKASVINFGDGLQNMTHDEKIRARKSSQQQDPPLSPMPSGPEDEDFYSAVGVPVEPSERRESIASASTATARSFRELHRKYSTAQAARSTSAGGRLTIPSDTESEVAVSFSDGRRSPLPPMETETDEESDGTGVRRGRSIKKDDLESRDSDSESLQDIEQLPSRPVQPVNA
ncbi:Protein transport protein sec73 [Fusarium oxysporum f. sp. cubense race 1]|uniref:Protein transport protein sec73 n=1 Tax=Fusarium oxysporum f. sp. cubense (strain race 1) TaxID=1229664 RepID=N4TZC0_FUSC1|nr:Protein transport protein sec73 [Fusarium oxysporum f. sp. cubense race 1]